MRYGQIRDLDVANGEGIRTSFFVTGCNFDCFNCFNVLYQDFGFGDIWTEDETYRIINNLQREEISGLSILGGEPFEHSIDLIEILKTIKKHSNKSIWIWSGYNFEDIIQDDTKLELLNLCDILIDGKYVEVEKDLKLKFRGSKNQRVIDIKKSLRENKIIEIY